MKKGIVNLSVVIPAYNEAENINRGSLEEVYHYLKNKTYKWEVLVVDDGSKDNTIELVENFIQSHQNFKLLKEPHRGKGGTVIAGMLVAQGEIILFTDMDQATPINQLESLLVKFDEGYDVAIGSRAGRKGAPLIRKIMAYGWVILRTVVLGLSYKDTQCGFKSFKRNAAKAIFEKLKVYKERENIQGAAVTAGFDLELLFIAKRLGLKVAEVPVEWNYKGSKRVSFVKDSLQAFSDLLRVRFNALSGKYGERI